MLDYNINEFNPTIVYDNNYYQLKSDRLKKLFTNIPKEIQQKSPKKIIEQEIEKLKKKI